MFVTQPDVRPLCASCGADLVADDRYCRHCGFARSGPRHAAAEAPATEDERVDPSVALLPTRPSKTSVIVAVAILGAVLATTIPILIVRSVFYGPDDTVHGYFDALADRDADAAWSMLAAGERGSREGSPLLGGDTLDNPGYQPPTNLKVDRLETTGGDAVADVTYDVAGQPQRMSLRMERGSGMLRRWLIKNGLLPIDVRTDSGAGVLVAGVSLPPNRSGSVTAFPGAYAVTLAEHPVLEAQPTTAVAGLATAVVPTSIRTDVRQQIEQQVRTYLDECAKSDRLEPEGCPFSAFSYDNVKDITWRITTYPQLEYQFDPGGRLFVGGRGGEAQVTAKAASEFSSDLARTVTFGVSGTVEVNGGATRFTPGPGD